MIHDWSDAGNGEERGGRFQANEKERDQAGEREGYGDEPEEAKPVVTGGFEAAVGALLTGSCETVTGGTSVFWV
jgi:hypothetical protein